MMEFWTNVLVVELGTWGLVKITLLLLGAWGVTALLRRASAAKRHAIWSIALVGVLLMPLLALVLPSWQAPLLSTSLSRWTGASYPSKQVARTFADAFSPLETNERPEADARDASMNAAPASATGPSSKRNALMSLPFSAWILLVWLGGVVFLLGRLTLDVARVVTLTRRARPLPVSSLSSLTDSLHMRRSVRIRTSSDVHVPMTWGLRHPTILLPDDAETWPAGRLRVVLLHELAHIKRHDYLVHLITRLACACYWFNPLVWTASKRIHREQEHACDDYVLRSGIRAYTYAEHLLAIAQAFRANRPPLHAAVAMAQAPIKQRIRTILEPTLNRHPLRPRTGALLIALAAVLMLPLTAMQLWNPDAGPRYLWLEAEAGTLQTPMHVKNDAAAMGWQYVVVPDGPGNNPPEGGPGTVTLRFDLDEAGTYVIWGRVHAPHDNDNSFYVSVDSGEEALWDVPVSDDKSTWIWDPISARGETTNAITAPVAYDLEAGPHTLRIRNREDGTLLDRVLVTNDTTFVPSGQGPLPDDVHPVRLHLEAESGTLYPPMDIHRDEIASGSQYVAVPGGPGNNPPEGGPGRVEFQLEVDQPGRYVVWGYALGPRDKDNSFYVSMDGGQEALWDVPVFDDTPTWTWDVVSTRDGPHPIIYHLEAGRHTLRVRNREDGTRLDRLVLTNDPTFCPDPAASSPIASKASRTR